MESITISDNAVKHIKSNLESRGSGIGIRFGVNTSGCNGLAYVLEFMDATFDDDVIIEKDGVSVAVDPKSLIYLAGTHIDYVREGLNEGFKFTNPNQSGQCGCGETFNV